jgi:LuxR family maltose regulon positive regulatory protein
VFHAAELDGDAIGEVRLLIYQGRSQQALERLSRLLDDPRYTRRRLRWLKLRMLQALALDSLGHAREARDAMQTVMHYAVPERLSRFVIEEAGFYAALERVATGPVAAGDRDANRLRIAYERLFAGHARPTAGTAELAAIHELLTEREVEILQMLSRGSGNREIGASLFVSENTVRYHLRNIYSKLGVKNRTEASNFALRHGLAG